MNLPTQLHRWQRAPGFAIGSRDNSSCTDKSIIRGLAYHQRVYRKVAEFVKTHPDLGYTWYEEPWLRNLDTGRMCQPDGVLIDAFTDGALVVEAKLNWKDGRDEKLIATYLQAVRSAFGLTATWPLLITSNVRGYKGRPLLGLTHMEKAYQWRPGLITPVLLLP